MTLLIAAGNSEYTVLVSDRRLTVRGVGFDDESNKALTLWTSDAKLAVAYTGLAQVQSFNTYRWLLDTLAECSRNTVPTEEALKRFARVATDTFRRLPVPSKDKRTSVLAVGYCYRFTYVQPVYALISNFERPPGPALATAQDFVPMFMSLPSAYTFSAGWATSELDVRLQEVADLVNESSPPQAVVNKVASVIQRFSHTNAAKNRVGGQCTSSILWSDPDQPVRDGYHTEHAGGRIYMPDTIFARGGDVHIVEGIEVALTNEHGQPAIVSVPRVGRNHPCPCGSGKKYKYCHGSRPWMDYPDRARPIAGCVPPDSHNGQTSIAVQEGDRLVIDLWLRTSDSSLIQPAAHDDYVVERPNSPMLDD